MRLKRILLAAVFISVVCATASIWAEQTRLAGMTEQGIEKLLSQMTLREKIGQLSQCGAGDAKAEQYAREGSIGSVLNAWGPERREKLQRIAVEESRLGIPLLIGHDIIHGYRTIFPIPLGQAAAWNPQLTEEAARIAAREAAACGVRWTFAPMVDIARDPRWGRIAEGCGEDPHLAGVLGAAMVRGFQGKDLRNPESIAACAKHYAAYGAAEGGRDYNTADISERTLRDVYLAPFESCVNAGVATLMSAFAEVNGVPATGNSFLLRQVLREEWKFNGFVVSDYESVREMVLHGLCVDENDAAREAILAGLDMEMVSTCYRDHLETLVAEGSVPMPAVDDAVRRILRLKWRLGLFDNPFAKSDADKVLLRTDHLDAARELARQSIVLLKNDRHVLPLRKELPSIAVIGPLADNGFDQLGCWQGFGERNDSRTALRGIREAVSRTTRINYVAGLKDTLSSDRGDFGDAARAAKESSVAVMFVGEGEALSGEAHSRAFLNLPGAQMDLIKAVHATGTPLVIVLMAGRPLEIGGLLDLVPAVMMAWHPGTMGGPAIADVLFGDRAPSGKLPVSWPRTVGQIPIHYNHQSTGRPWTDPFKLPREGGGGFITGYIDLPHTPQFPFGYGLSYTRFEYSDLRVEPKRIKLGGTVRVTAKITNAGNQAGDEIAQLYVRDLVGSVPRPVRELKGFLRINLAPGGSRTVEFTLPTEALAFHDRNMKRVTEPGRFRVWIGADSASGPSGEFDVE